MSRPTGNDGCDPTEPAKAEEKDVLSDDSDDEIASGAEKGEGEQINVLKILLISIHCLVNNFEVGWLVGLSNM